MKRDGKLWEKVDKDLVREAAINALRSKTTSETRDFREKLEENIDIIWSRLQSGYYLKPENQVYYTPLVKMSHQGKRREISCCSIEWRIVMHVILILIKPRFMKYLVKGVYNCIPGRGITALDKNRSMLTSLKHAFYDKREMMWYIKMDIKGCYASTKEEVVYNAQKRLIKDPIVLDYLKKLSMCSLGLPIGTPLSPINHHMVMFKFDHLVTEKYTNEVVEYARYADDIFIGVKTKKGGQKLLKELKEYLEKELGYTLNKNTRLCPVRVPLDFGGYVFNRNMNLKEGEHKNKGWCRLRKSIKERAKRRINMSRETCASYFGLICKCDGKNLWEVLKEKYIKNMKLKEIAANLKVKENLVNVPIVDINEIVDKTVDILKYELRKSDKKNGSVWISMILGEKDKDRKIENPWTKEVKQKYKLVRVKGSYRYLYEFLEKLDKQMEREAEEMGISFTERQKVYFPIEEVKIVEQGGYIFDGSVEMTEEIEVSEAGNLFPDMSTNSLVNKNND